jgi:hypothetical protein
MPTKKTTTKKATTKAKAPAKTPAKAAAKKAAPAPRAAKAEAKPVGPRHPKGRVIARHGSKEALAKSLAEALARDDEDTDVLAGRLGKASNTQLLRLQHVVDTVKAKFGNRGKLIEAIGTAQHKSKDKDYLAKLDTYSLPHLLELATSTQRAATA